MTYIRLHPKGTSYFIAAPRFARNDAGVLWNLVVLDKLEQYILRVKRSEIEKVTSLFGNIYVLGVSLANILGRLSCPLFLPSMRSARVLFHNPTLS